MAYICCLAEINKFEVVSFFEILSLILIFFYLFEAAIVGQFTCMYAPVG